MYSIGIVFDRLAQNIAKLHEHYIFSKLFFTSSNLKVYFAILSQYIYSGTPKYNPVQPIAFRGHLMNSSLYNWLFSLKSVLQHICVDGMKNTGQVREEVMEMVQAGLAFKMTSSELCRTVQKWKE